ncbi:DUF4352 domain-containing protein [Priestia megaterium]|uniref:DUF4352 domain-containing protein n=1 Tax=Priestia megaterium TaxID=1404 RepID=UPI000BFD7EAA|nr:DUF4352 domain-containing protein [Priestia megaterium]PGN64364.1 hypothetical protein CN978_24040 [Priestia megaterium]
MKKNFKIGCLGFIILIALIVVIAVVASGGDDSGSGSGSSSNSSKSEEQKAHKVGDTFTVDDKAEVSVTKVEEREQVGNQYANKKASEGGTLVAIQWTVKNISDKPLGAFSTPTINLIDEKGTKYDADIDATSNYAVETNIDDSKIASDLNPGIKVTDVDVFEVSKDSYAKGKWYIEINRSKVQIK